MRLAYLAFDTVPAPKGAAVHIEAFTQALAARFGSLRLITVAPGMEVLEQRNRWPGINHLALPALGPSLIHRVLHFRSQLIPWLTQQVQQQGLFDVIHIRSIYEGFPIAAHKSHYSQHLIFEVNGLPSIELKYRYPDVAEDQDLRFKLQAQEQVCLQRADRVVTPSEVTAQYLRNRGVAAHKLRVIPNGVDVNLFFYQLPLLRVPSNESVDTSIDNLNKFNPAYPLKLLYFGTLSPWQGVDLAIRALAIVTQTLPAHLTVIASASKRQRQGVLDLARKLQVRELFHLLDPVAQPDLVTYLHNSHALLAPLTWNDRNLIQGCCPLKVLEGMATGTPVITSDLPVVRELGEPDQHFLAVKPGSVQAIVDAILRLVQEENLASYLAQSARQRVVTAYTWERAGQAIGQCYAELWS